MPDGSLLAQRARVYIESLVSTIGPRPAGSPAEAQARQFVAARLAEWGYAVQRQPAGFAPSPRFAWLLPAGGLILVAGAWGQALFPWLGLLPPMAFFALPQASRWLMRRRPLSSWSENLVAYTTTMESSADTLVLCAHLDSAPAVALGGLGLRLYSHGLDLAQRSALAVAALAFLRLLGFVIPAWLYLLVCLAASLVGAWLVLSELWNGFSTPRAYAPGAVDDASGVAVLLALAEHFAACPLQRLRLGFLFTGAEETGLHGARAFAASLLPGSRLRLLGLDMVSAGDTLRFASRDGTLLPLRTDPVLNAHLQAACPGIRPLWYTHRSGDFAEFLQAGLPASSLEVTGSPQAALAYHTLDDTLARVEIPALEMTCRAVLALVSALDQAPV